MQVDSGDKASVNANEKNVMHGIRSLTLVSSGIRRNDPDKEQSDELPRSSLYERTLKTVTLDETSLSKSPWWRRGIYKILPASISMAIETYLVRKKFDVVISWSDKNGLLFASLLKLTHTKFPHVALMFWISKPRKAAILKRVHSHISTMILWTSTHRDFAINHLGIPPEKIRFITYYVDHKFFRPMPRETDRICSVGVEMRDYPTLIKAMRGLDIKCHIAAGMTRGFLQDTVKAIYREPELPPNLTVGLVPMNELRNLYARSRFVVTPLLPTDSDNGLTAILEAMAMGKAVICSRTKGQVDVIIDGKTGIFVPQGDPVALREAIKYLWENPAVAEEMGREGRKRIEEKFTWDQFVDNIKNIVIDTVENERRRANRTNA